MTSALAVRSLSRRYGGIAAVDHVDLDVPAGAVTSLIGPNGAGKTTLFHCVAGLERADSGRVECGGVDMTRYPAHRRARAGLGWTFQRLEVFAGLSVAENLRVGAENRTGVRLVAGLLGLPDRRRREHEATVTELLGLLGLTEVADVAVRALPTGTMRLVELGRALAARPHVLLLDEPASGLDDKQADALAELLRGLAASGMAILVVEHDIELVRRVSDTLAVMAGGRIIAHGEPAAVLAQPSVRAAYLAGTGGG